MSTASRGGNEQSFKDSKFPLSDNNCYQLIVGDGVAPERDDRQAFKQMETRISRPHLSLEDDDLLIVCVMGHDQATSGTHLLRLKIRARHDHSFSKVSSTRSTAGTSTSLQERWAPSPDPSKTPEPKTERFKFQHGDEAQATSSSYTSRRKEQGPLEEQVVQAMKYQACSSSESM